MGNSFSTLASDPQLATETQRALYFENSYGNSMEKARSLSRFMSRQEFAKILAYAELFRLTNSITGTIAECGVFLGGGFCTYANLSASLEPYNYQSKILGFDTFSGNTTAGEIDKSSKVDFSNQRYEANSYDDLNEFIRLYDSDRPLGHIEKLKLIKGDLMQTAPTYISENPETIFRIIHLSVNLYEPTRVAIQNFEPRLSSGGIIAVHAVNYSSSPTLAMLDGLKQQGYLQLRINNIAYYPNICFWVKP